MPRRRAAFVALALAAFPVVGVAGALPDALRDEAIALHAQAEAATGPGGDTLALFAGTRVPALRLRHVTLRVDDGPRVHREYDDREGRAIAAGGLDPILRVPLAPGDHRLRVEIIARHVDDKPGEARIRQRADLAFTTTPGASRIGLEILDLGFSGNAELGLHTWSSTATPADDDPDVRAATALANAGRPLEARVALARLALDAPGFGLPTSTQVALDAAERTDPSMTAAFDDAAISLQGNASSLAAFLASPSCAAPDADLCDRARLLIGYQALRANEGERAAAAFRAVHVPGPYATRALLGLGWALLAPPQPRVVDASLVPAAETAGVVAYRRARLASSADAKSRRQALLAALVPWSDLVGRDALDPASQEGLLAIAWALDGLGAHEQATARWSSAADQLEAARTQLDTALAEAADGRLAARACTDAGEGEDGWVRTLAPAAHADPTGALHYLMVDPDAAAAIDDLRTVHRLATWASNDARLLPADGGAAARDLAPRLAVVRERLAAAENAQDVRVAAAARAALLRMREQTEGYLAEARFALARVYDRSAEREIP